ncbi:MAG: hypothetical protein ACYC9N_08610, partial [Thermoanaerobaculia bacterium]
FASGIHRVPSPLTPLPETHIRIFDSHPAGERGTRLSHPRFPLRDPHIPIRHQLRQLPERHPRRPPQHPLRLRRIAQQQLHLGGTQIPRIDLHERAPALRVDAVLLQARPLPPQLDAGARKRELAELANRVRLAAARRLVVEEDPVAGEEASFRSP